MRAAELKRRRGRAKNARPQRNGKRSSFRDLKAFGLWSDRDDIKDPVSFVKQLRIRLLVECGGGWVWTNRER
jgi:hypothetical protein